MKARQIEWWNDDDREWWWPPLIIDRIIFVIAPGLLMLALVLFIVFSLIL